MESQGNRMYTLQELCRFLIPSVLGTVIFLLPIQWQGNMTILIGIITDLMQKLLAPVITTVVAAAIVLSAVCSTVRPVSYTHLDVYKRQDPGEGT